MFPVWLSGPTVFWRVLIFSMLNIVFICNWTLVSFVINTSIYSQADALLMNVSHYVCHHEYCVCVSSSSHLYVLATTLIMEHVRRPRFLTNEFMKCITLGVPSIF